MGEGLGELLLAEGKLADGPDFGVLRGRLASMHLSKGETDAVGERCGTHGLEGLALLGLEGTGLDGNDFGSGIRVVGNGRAALGAEEAVDVVARGTLARVFLDGALDGELVLGDDGDEGFGDGMLASSEFDNGVTWREREGENVQ